MNKLLNEILEECKDTPSELAEAALGVIALKIHDHLKREAEEARYDNRGQAPGN